MMETERLILRSRREDDVESLLKYAQDPDGGPITGRTSVLALNPFKG